MRDDVCFLRPSECNFQHSLPLRTKHLPGRSQRIWLLSCVVPTNNAGCVLPLEGVHKPVCSTDEATRIASLKGQIQAARNIEAEKFPEILRLTNEINLPEQVGSAKKKQKNPRRKSCVKRAKRGNCRARRIWGWRRACLRHLW